MLKYNENKQRDKSSQFHSKLYLLEQAPAIALVLSYIQTIKKICIPKIVISLIRSITEDPLQSFLNEEKYQDFWIFNRNAQVHAKKKSE